MPEQADAAPPTRVRPRARDTRALAHAAITGLRLDRPADWLHTRIVPAARRNRLDDQHQRLLMSFCLAADANCVDVGAHSGTLLSEMIRCAPEGRHIAFEPLPHKAAELRRAFPDVDVRELALSDEPGESEFVHVATNPQLSGLRQRDYPGQQRLERLTVTTARLDDALPAGYAPALLKIDVEGAELLVLRGAERTLRAHRPIVCFEHGAGAAEHYATAPSAAIHDLLADVGLRIFDIDGHGPYTRDRFVAAFHRPVWNWVAHA
jgi:FkbM family methyltransferase